MGETREGHSIHPEPSSVLVGETRGPAIHAEPGGVLVRETRGRPNTQNREEYLWGRPG